MNKIQAEDTASFEWYNLLILNVMVPDKDEPTSPPGTELVLIEE